MCLRHPRAGVVRPMVHVVVVTESEGSIFTTQVSSKLILISARRERGRRGRYHKARETIRPNYEREKERHDLFFSSQPTVRNML